MQFSVKWSAFSAELGDTYQQFFTPSYGVKFTGKEKSHAEATLI